MQQQKLKSFILRVFESSDVPLSIVLPHQFLRSCRFLQLSRPCNRNEPAIYHCFPAKRMNLYSSWHVDSFIKKNRVARLCCSLFSRKFKYTYCLNIVFIWSSLLSERTWYRGFLPTHLCTVAEISLSNGSIECNSSRSIQIQTFESQRHSKCIRCSNRIKFIIFETRHSFRSALLLQVYRLYSPSSFNPFSRSDTIDTRIFRPLCVCNFLLDTSETHAHARERFNPDLTAFHGTLTSSIISLPQNPRIEFISNHFERRMHILDTVAPRKKFFRKFLANSSRIRTAVLLFSPAKMPHRDAISVPENSSVVSTSNRLPDQSRYRWKSLHFRAYTLSWEALGLTRSARKGNRLRSKCVNNCVVVELINGMRSEFRESPPFGSLTWIIYDKRTTICQRSRVPQIDRSSQSNNRP